jgi:hypothetical protein
MCVCSLSRLLSLNVLRNLHVIVLHFVGPRAGDVAHDPRRLHGRVALVVRSRNPPERDFTTQLREPIAGQWVLSKDGFRIARRFMSGPILVALVQYSIRWINVVPPGVIDRKKR